MTGTIVFDKLAIIGAGLIGSSLARAARAENACGHIALFDTDPETTRRLHELELGQICSNVRQAVQDADLVIICTSPGQIAPVAKNCMPMMKTGAILSDTGSIKTSILQQLSPVEGVYLIPTHPIAGTEYSGPDAGFASLFVGRWCVFTPISQDTAYARAVERLGRFWQQIGARIQLMDAEHHDKVMAMTSHMPHLIAYAMVATAMTADSNSEKEIIRYSGGGFRDFTRIASSDPLMWRDVFLGNAGPVLEMLDSFTGQLEQLRQAIITADGKALSELFAATRHVREQIIDEGEDIKAADFGRLRS